VANIQIKGIDDDLYNQIKKLAASENRSVCQQVLFLVKAYLAKKHEWQKVKIFYFFFVSLCLSG
jgi:hypothetical protein